MALFDDASLVVTPNGYKAGTLYSIKPTSGAGDMTVVRATTATRVNSAGLIESMANNVPRLDYLNASCPSLLVEPQRSNLALYSEQFDNAGWGKSGVTITANNTTSPDGTSNADLVTTTNATSHELLQSKIVTGVHTCSFYVKKNNSQTFYINMYSNGWTAYFNLNNGTVSSVVGSGVTANVTNAGNGWYRCSITFTSVSSEIQLGFLDTVYTGVAGNPWTIPTSVGTSGWVWGAQLEAGAYATSYIPTTSAAVTRNADVISKTGISSLIGQTEGTLFWDINVDIISGTDSENIINIDNGSFGTTLYLIKTSVGTLGGELYNGGVVQFSSTTSITQEGRYKCALAYKTNDFALYINGVQIAIDSSGTVGAMSRLQLGQGVLGASVGNTNSAILFPTRLTNAELAQLTTL